MRILFKLIKPAFLPVLLVLSSLFMPILLSSVTLVAQEMANLVTTLPGGEAVQGASGPLQFVPVTPCRVVDTRGPDGPLAGPAIQGGTFRSFPITQGSCNIPSTAAAYLLNVTVVPQGQLSSLTVYPTGEDPGVTITLVSLDGRVKSDAAITPAGTNQAINVYAANTTNVVLDIAGYFAPASRSTLAYYPLTPCRVIDTRNPNGPLGGPFLNGGEERDFPILQATTCNIPASARAYSFNVAALPRAGGPLPFLTVWAAGEAQPVVGTLTDFTGTVVSNAAIVPAGTGGAIAAYPDGNTDLVVDINGYFDAPGAGGLSLYPINPCRAFDSRHIVVAFDGLLRIPVLGARGDLCAFTSDTQVVVFNATAMPRGELDYLTLWPDGQPKPLAWNLNAVDGAVTSNLAIVQARRGSAFSVDAYGAGTTQLLLDVSSYFGP